MTQIIKRINKIQIITLTIAITPAPDTRKQLQLQRDFNNAKNDYTEKPSNVEVTLKGPVNKEQLFKIQEILRNPRVYRDKLPKGQQPDW